MYVNYHSGWILSYASESTGILQVMRSNQSHHHYGWQVDWAPQRVGIWHSTRYAYIEFAQEESVENALLLNETLFKERLIKVIQNSSIRSLARGKIYRGCQGLSLLVGGGEGDFLGLITKAGRHSFEAGGDKTSPMGLGHMANPTNKTNHLWRIFVLTKPYLQP